MVKIKCHMCGYVWNYKGILIGACCPSCHVRVMVKNCQVDESTPTTREEHAAKVRA